MTATMTMREWLSTQKDETTGLPLARTGTKGRFSRAAKAALLEAMIGGMEFTDSEEKEKAPREKRVSTGATAAVRVKAPTRDYDLKHVRKWAAENDIAISQRGRISADILVQYDKANPVSAKAEKVVAPPRPRVRPENVAYALSEPPEAHMSRVSVAFEKCSRCTERVGWCKCEQGPVAPSFMNGALVSLSKP
jgi:hypothetical protein